MNTESPFRVQRSLVHAAILVATLGIGLAAITLGDYKLLAGLIVLLFLPLLIRSPAWMLVGVFALWGAKITLPGLPATLLLQDVFAFLLAGWLTARRLISHGAHTLLQPWPGRASSFFLALYIAVLVLIILVRGIGSRFTSETQWGGGKYAILFIAALFFWTASRFPLGRRAWTFLLIAFTLGHLVPFFAEWASQRWGTRFDVSRFVQPSFVEASELEGMDIGSAQFRIYPLALLGTALTVATLALVPLRMPTLPGAALLLSVSIAFAALAGFRSHFIMIAGTIFLFYMLRRDRIAFREIIPPAVLAAIAWLTLVLAVPSLPPVVQRALSFIPGLPIQETVAVDALGTITWRVDLWKLSLQYAPPYYWVGRGFLFSPDELPLHSNPTLGLLHMYLKHTYHSGPVSLLIDTGIPGLIACTAFFLAALIEAARAARDIPANTLFGRSYRALGAFLAMQVFFFYAVIGDPVFSVKQILLTFALMKIARLSHLAETQDDEPAAAPS